MPRHDDAEGQLTDAALNDRCADLRALHIPGDPLLLPNCWDVASARVVADAGFPVVATTSGGVAASLGYADHEAAPPAEMLAAAARIARAVEVPVTVDAEAGYGLQPADLVGELRRAGVAGCNLEDTDHSTGTLKDAADQASRLRAVRDAATQAGYRLVVNARIDVFLGGVLAGDDTSQHSLVEEALRRAHAYVDAGADCVFPIALWERDALGRFVREAPGPVNVLRIPRAPAIADLAELGVARVSWGSLLHRDSMRWLAGELESLASRLRRRHGNT
jgi:2-methylisocitrate lyase-like PEP mutase family enzyme